MYDRADWNPRVSCTFVDTYIQATSFGALRSLACIRLPNSCQCGSSNRETLASAQGFRAVDFQVSQLVAMQPSSPSSSFNFKMASHHHFSDHLTERVRSIDSQHFTSGSSRSSSRRSSLCSSNRGSAYSEESAEVLQDLQDLESREIAEQELRLDDAVESKVCSSCKEEFQVQQALSVQQARQRYISFFAKSSVSPWWLFYKCQIDTLASYWSIRFSIGVTYMEALDLFNPYSVCPNSNELYRTAS